MCYYSKNRFNCVKNKQCRKWNIQIWSKAPENGGYVLQKIPFNISTAGPANTRVPIGAILSTGNYFMNVEITGGNGILYRAIDGATYPYSVSNLISITGTNFPTDPDRYYYFFDWKVSKMCMSPFCAKSLMRSGLNPLFCIPNNSIKNKSC